MEASRLARRSDFEARTIAVASAQLGCTVQVPVDTLPKPNVGSEPLTTAKLTNVLTICAGESIAVEAQQTHEVKIVSEELKLLISTSLLRSNQFLGLDSSAMALTTDAELFRTIK